jgi:hypothetical protein
MWAGCAFKIYTITIHGLWRMTQIELHIHEYFSHEVTVKALANQKNVGMIKVTSKRPWLNRRLLDSGLNYLFCPMPASEQLWPG